jgi:thioredoxin reductase
MNSQQRAEALASYIQNCEVNNVSIKIDEDTGEDTESFFGTCDCCDEKSDVYETEGYSSKHKEVFSTGDICHACICIAYNGIED